MVGKKTNIGFTIQGRFTKKQADKLEGILLKIAERFKAGFGSWDED